MRVLWISRYRGHLNGYRPEGEILIDLKRSGVDIEFMGLGDEAYLARIGDHGIPIIPFTAPQTKIDIAAIKMIRAQLQSKPYDLAIAFQGSSIAALCFAAIGIAVKTVAYRGQTGNIYRYDPTSYLTMLHPRLDAIICVAKAIEDDLRPRVWRRHKPAITTIYKGHDIGWYNPWRHGQSIDLQARLGIPRDAFVIAFAANLRPRKGLHILIQSAKYLADNSRVHFLIMGEGTAGGDVKQQIDATAQGNRFHCLGYRNDVVEWLSCCHATVLPTLKREGLSRSIIESMAMGIPVIASDTGGNGELVEDGVSGYIVPPGEATALAAAIQKMATNRAETAAMGRRSRRRIADHFNHEQTVIDYRAFFEQLISSP